jgi:FkbM family methyltransferase
MKSAFGRGAYLLSFEPLLDKYAFLQKTSRNHDLGMQHIHGMVIPFAVGCKGTATFNIAPNDGCSSLLPPNPTFVSEQKRASVKWFHWVGGSCATNAENRTVPCISLEEVIRDWLNGFNVKHIKIDAQGFDLNVVKSAGSMVDRIESIKMEVLCEGAARLYANQPTCKDVQREMIKLGFKPEFNMAQCSSCVETDVYFTRKPRSDLPPLESVKSIVQDGIFAPVHVAHIPFWKEQPPPTELWLEISHGSMSFLQNTTEMRTAFYRGAYLVTFEPQSYSYAFMLMLYGGKQDKRMPLGKQSNRGTVLPFAVGCKESIVLSGVKVTCISLEKVIKEWLGGMPIKHLRTDAHALNLAAVKSAGSMMDRIETVRMNTKCNGASNEWLDCMSTYREMQNLGFEAQFDLKECNACEEFEASFRRGGGV